MGEIKPIEPETDENGSTTCTNSENTHDKTTDDSISRRAAIDTLAWFTQKDPLGHTPKQIVEALPSAKPERKKGKWIWDENGMDWGLGAWKCNRCHSKAETWWANDKKYNPLRCAGGQFCGVCGADMRG